VHQVRDALRYYCVDHASTAALVGPQQLLAVVGRLDLPGQVDHGVGAGESRLQHRRRGGLGQVGGKPLHPGVRRHSGWGASADADNLVSPRGIFSQRAQQRSAHIARCSGHHNSHASVEHSARFGAR